MEDLQSNSNHRRSHIETRGTLQMKRVLLIILVLTMLLCTTAFGADDGEIILQIPDNGADLGWLADDATADGIVELISAEPEDDAFVIRYAPLADGETTVAARHYTGFACDRLFTWDLVVKDGAGEVTGGSYTEAPDQAAQDPYMSGVWMASPDLNCRMTASANEGGRGWDVEIQPDDDAFIFKTTIYYDCDLDSFVYDKGKFWDVPESGVELGEARQAGTTGSFILSGEEEDLRLSWSDDTGVEYDFIRTPRLVRGESQIYTAEEIDAAMAVVLEDFAGWEGCELHELSYLGDDCNSEENIAWVNDLQPGKDYAQCIQFSGNYRSPADAYGAWEPDTEYFDWTWTLARPDGGEWTLVTSGY